MLFTQQMFLTVETVCSSLAEAMQGLYSILITPRAFPKDFWPPKNISAL